MCRSGGPRRREGRRHRPDRGRARRPDRSRPPCGSADHGRPSTAPGRSRRRSRHRTARERRRPFSRVGCARPAGTTSDRRRPRRGRGRTASRGRHAPAGRRRTPYRATGRGRRSEGSDRGAERPSAECGPRGTGWPRPVDELIDERRQRPCLVGLGTTGGGQTIEPLVPLCRPAYHPGGGRHDVPAAGGHRPPARPHGDRRGGEPPDDLVAWPVTAGQLEQAEEGPPGHRSVQTVLLRTVAGHPGRSELLTQYAGVGGAGRMEDRLVPQRDPGFGGGDDRSHGAACLLVGVGAGPDLGEGAPRGAAPLPSPMRRAPRWRRISFSVGATGPSCQVTTVPSDVTDGGRRREAAIASSAMSATSASPQSCRWRRTAPRSPTRSPPRPRRRPMASSVAGGHRRSSSRARRSSTRADGWDETSPIQPSVAPACVLMTSRSTAGGANRSPRAASGGPPSIRTSAGRVVQLTLAQPRRPFDPDHVPRTRRTKTAAYPVGATTVTGARGSSPLASASSRPRSSSPASKAVEGAEPVITAGMLRPGCRPPAPQCAGGGRSAVRPPAVSATRSDPGRRGWRP